MADELRPKLVLLSGAVTAGKSSLATALITGHDFRKISTSGHLTELAAARGLENRRDVLQGLGDGLDEETDYLWPIDIARKQIAAGGQAGLWLVDAVRKQRQVRHFRNAFAEVVHVHVTAPEDVLRARYLTRQLQVGSRDAQGAYDELIKSPNEIASRSLEASADLVFDSSSMSAAAMADAVVQRLMRSADGASSTDQRSLRGG